MPLVIISIPLMVLALAVAAIPLLVLSRREHTGRLESVEQREHALAFIEARRNVQVATAGPIATHDELPLAA
jgi:hypothetical protein